MSWGDEIREKIKKIGIDNLTAKDFVHIASEFEVNVISVVKVHNDMLREKHDVMRSSGTYNTPIEKKRKSKERK